MSIFFSTTSTSSPSRSCFLIHLLSLASQIFINITVAVISPTKLKPILISDAQSAYHHISAYFNSKGQAPNIPGFENALRQLLTSSSSQLNFPLNPLWLSGLLSSSDPISKTIFSILQPAIYLVLTHFRFFSPTDNLFPYACFASVQQQAKASYYRLITITQLQTLARLSRSLKAVRTTNTFRASLLSGPSDSSIQHDHPIPSCGHLPEHSALLRPFTPRGPIFIKRTSPPTERYVGYISDLAESAHIQLRNVHPDDYLDQPFRQRRFYLVKAFRDRIKRAIKPVTVFEDEEDDYGPIDPSWL
ncbi:uncharacterized protein MELLADRAFT_73651 [Melampsora larici-populina 98AG31]|uniref:Uncharacterized protein n=1 Tax=Melampsora larici-populina (strain 98AG31 / pathotype 3-4-7) TaxID=747676 RepID=F4SB37_MELLP|nr:uncharacterized protein MELLADRAFT_73651 [Melampsora larici-populina 98AG31]EGF98124.1 hypothetical protein MELLADRAFT_73651 [Melampsora larici-populina 98AG31]